MPDLQPLLAAFVPIWVLTAIGYLVSRTGVLGEQAEQVLVKFVFLVAMPAQLFTVVGRTPLGAFANASMLAFAAGTVAASALGLAAGRWLFGRRSADQAINSMAAGYVNSGNLGIPVAVQVLGDASLIAPVLLFQVLLVTPLVLAALDAGTGGERRPAALARRALLLPLRNPIILGAGLGALCSATAWHPPAALGHSFELLGNAAVPTALITLGMSLHGRSAASSSALRAETGVTVAIKTLVQPLAALAFGALVLHLPEHQLLAVVLLSALPTAQNVFTYAKQYGLGTALARESVLGSTLLSMVTLSGITWLLSTTGH
ncbi:AEC family transporter [Kitasatospora sp. NPDC048365]|uniref:AEC family transporter n=1 Tax=Kitasatospora sp. NPDC048365 TaxID=3364050 RepID=UPI00372203D6